MFVDEARIFVKGGRGGDGCVSFLREKYRPKGGPDGGTGGQGGDVIIEADNEKSTLAEFHKRRHFSAGNGVRGGPRHQKGRGGGDLVIKVPVGTVIRNDSGQVLADLAEDRAQVVVARGGRPGRGNAYLVREVGPLPRFAERGEPGEEFSLLFELKLVADVAIVGFPNVGKSSLISRISRARPKIADYPFTTVEPNLGVVVGDEFDYVVTDVPGLVEGAHEGKGMGIAFLRHIERAPVLLQMVDLSPLTGREPVDDLLMIEEELRLYNPALLDRRRVIVANKIDLGVEYAVIESVRAASSERGLRFFAVSVVSGEGLAQMLGHVSLMVEEAREEGFTYGLDVEYRFAEDDLLSVDRNEEGRYVVSGAYVERLVRMTDWNNEEAVAHLARKLKKMGVEEMLAAFGARSGDEVEVAGQVFEYLPDGTQPRSTEDGPDGDSADRASGP